MESARPSPEEIKQKTCDETSHFALVVAAEWMAANARWTYYVWELDRLRNPSAAVAQHLGPAAMSQLTTRIGVAEALLKDAERQVAHWHRVLLASEFVTAAVTIENEPEDDENHRPLSPN